jgi:sec-independent protein translocase protein TatB
VDILGIGPLELVLILVIALLVFGPDKLPEIGAKMGKGVRELRQLSREISQGVNTITEPMDELRKPFDEAGQIVGQVSATASALRNPAQALQQSLEKQLTPSSAEPAAAAQTTAVQTAGDNTIAPPRSPEPTEPIAALPASSNAVEALDQTGAPAVQPFEEVAPLARSVEETAIAAPAQSFDIAGAAAAPDTSADAAPEVVAAVTADPSTIEPPAQASER